MSPSLDQIRKHTAVHFGIRVKAMRSGRPRDTFRVAHARQAAMYLAREMTRCSLPQVGRHFRRDHTTVLHAVRAVTKRQEADPRLVLRLHIIRWSIAFLAPYIAARGGR